MTSKANAINILSNILSHKTIMIIGGTGSLGNALVKRFSEDASIKIIIVSRDENKQWFMKMEFPFLTFVIGDMRNLGTMEKILSYHRPDIVIVAGALKHIDICENNINESIQTNILGVQNIVNAIMNIRTVQSVLMISTDKACSPINVYGMCKAIAERIFAEASLKCSTTNFLCVRYGNVLNSRGSIIPKFKEIARNEKLGEFTVTNPNMTRFYMTLEQSVDLIITTLIHGENGDMWIPKVESFKLDDLAKYFSTRYDKPIKYVPIRTSEKLHECLINISEIARTDMRNIKNKTYYVIKRCYSSYNFNHLSDEYTSDKHQNFENLIPLIGN